MPLKEKEKKAPKKKKVKVEVVKAEKVISTPAIEKLREEMKDLPKPPQPDRAVFNLKLEKIDEQLTRLQKTCEEAIAKTDSVQNEKNKFDKKKDQGKKELADFSQLLIRFTDDKTKLVKRLQKKLKDTPEEETVLKAVEKIESKIETDATDPSKQKELADSITNFAKENAGDAKKELEELSSAFKKLAVLKESKATKTREIVKMVEDRKVQLAETAKSAEMQEEAQKEIAVLVEARKDLKKAFHEEEVRYKEYGKDLRRIKAEIIVEEEKFKWEESQRLDELADQVVPFIEEISDLKTAISFLTKKMAKFKLDNKAEVEAAEEAAAKEARADLDPLRFEVPKGCQLINEKEGRNHYEKKRGWIDLTHKWDSLKIEQKAAGEAINVKHDHQNDVVEEMENLRGGKEEKVKAQKLKKMVWKLEDSLITFSEKYKLTVPLTLEAAKTTMTEMAAELEKYKVKQKQALEQKRIDAEKAAEAEKAAKEAAKNAPPEEGEEAAEEGEKEEGEEAGEEAAETPEAEAPAAEEAEAEEAKAEGGGEEAEKGEGDGDEEEAEAAEEETQEVLPTLEGNECGLGQGEVMNEAKLTGFTPRVYFGQGIMSTDRSAVAYVPGQKTFALNVGASLGILAVGDGPLSGYSELEVQAMQTGQAFDIGLGLAPRHAKKVTFPRAYDFPNSLLLKVNFLDLSASMVMFRGRLQKCPTGKGESACQVGDRIGLLYQDKVFTIFHNRVPVIAYECPLGDSVYPLVHVFCRVLQVSWDLSATVPDFTPPTPVSLNALDLAKKALGPSKEFAETIVWNEGGDANDANLLWG